jgi:excisionase family DNA binding protein
MHRRIDSSQFEASEIEAMLTIARSQQKPALVDSEGKRTEIPEPVFQVLKDLAEYIKQGQAVFLMNEEETFTTQAAANFLGVSRQHFVDLLETDVIPYHKVGSHRRVYFRDLKEYADQRDSGRRKAMDELFDKVSKADKYDSSYTGDER